MFTAIVFSFGFFRFFSTRHGHRRHRSATVRKRCVYMCNPPARDFPISHSNMYLRVPTACKILRSGWIGGVSTSKKSSWEVTGAQKEPFCPHLTPRDTCRAPGLSVPHPTFPIPGSAVPLGPSHPRRQDRAMTTMTRRSDARDLRRFGRRKGTTACVLLGPQCSTGEGGLLCLHKREQVRSC